MIAGVQHVSNYFHTRPQLILAKMLVDSSRTFDRAFFCNSGTEANEAALKFARKFALVQAMAAAAKGAAADATPWPPAFSAFACKSSADAACATRGGMCDCWPQATLPGLRTGIVAFKNGFHGRTMGALAATHKPAIRQPFGPFPPDVQFARYNSSAGAPPAAVAMAPSLFHERAPPSTGRAAARRCPPPRRPDDGRCHRRGRSRRRRRRPRRKGCV